MRLTWLFEASNRYSKSTFNTLKSLIPEICFFPVSLFKDLNIKKLVLAEGESSVNRVLTSREDALSFGLMDSHYKLLEKLYKMIFNALVTKHPEMVDEWIESEREDDPDHLSKDLFASFRRFEEVFMALMKNLHQVSLRDKIFQARNIIGKYYPELSEEWLTSRNREKKKSARVTFGDDSVIEI